MWHALLAGLLRRGCPALQFPGAVCARAARTWEELCVCVESLRVVVGECEYMFWARRACTHADGRRLRKASKIGLVDNRAPSHLVGRRGHLTLNTEHYSA